MMSDWPDRMIDAAYAGGKPCSLRQACAKAGLDRGGRRCAECPLWGLCQSDTRWLIKTEREEFYRC
jgi:hypothetical protein